MGKGRDGAIGIGRRDELMKISTNFVSTRPGIARPLIAGLLGLALLSLALIAWLLHDAASLRTELPQLRKRLLNVEANAQTAPQPPADTPTSKELSDTRNRVIAVNAATKTRGMSTVALLSELEKLLPAQAWLISLHHRAADGEVMLVAAAPSAPPLSDFLLQLERDPKFAEVLLLRESQGGSGTDVQYEIRLKVRP